MFIGRRHIHNVWFKYRQRVFFFVLLMTRSSSAGKKKIRLPSLEWDDAGNSRTLFVECTRLRRKFPSVHDDGLWWWWRWNEGAYGRSFSSWRDVKEHSEQLKKKIQSPISTLKRCLQNLFLRPNQKTGFFPERKCP